MSEDFVDKVRNLNAFLAAVGFTMMVLEVRGLWDYLSRARKMRYFSLSCFAFAVFYGSLEAAYWPAHNIRVLWVTVAVVSMVFAGACGNMERAAIIRHQREKSDGREAEQRDEEGQASQR